MMKHYLFLSLFLFFASCDNGKWWGDRKIAEISITSRYDVRKTNFSYDNEGRLSHYSSKQISSMKHDSLNVYFDVEFEYTDTAVVVKGWMPYICNDENGYANGTIVYRLNRAGVAVSAIATYDLVLDTVKSEKYVAYGLFKYNENMMLKEMWAGGQGARYYSSKDYSICYNASDNRRKSDIYSSLTYIDYTKTVNQSCLGVGPLQRDLMQHLPAFYAKLLGRPSKYLVSKDVTVVGNSRVQLIDDYTYQLDDRGYITSYTLSRASNFKTAGNDLFSEESTNVITYVN